MQVKIIGNAFHELKSHGFPAEQPQCWRRMISETQVGVDAYMQQVTLVDLDEQDMLLVRLALVNLNYDLTEQRVSHRASASRTAVDVRQTIENLDRMIVEAKCHTAELEKVPTSM